MPHTFLRLPAVRAGSGLLRSTLYLRMGQGLWPQPVRLGVRRRDAADVPVLKIAAAVAAGEKSATRIGLAAASPELSCTKRTECPILTIAVMKGNLKRSPKAPAKSKGGLPGRSNKGARGHFDPGAGNREDVRQQTRRVNVPRHSQRPTERSSQRRSRRP